VRAARDDIVVFMDASSLCKTDALTNLAAAFADPGAGCVAGKNFVRFSSRKTDH